MITTVLVTIAVLTLIDAATLFVVYKKREILIPRIRVLLGAASSEFVRDVEHRVSETETCLDKALNAGDEEVIDLGRRIDEVSDKVEALTPKKKMARRR